MCSGLSLRNLFSQYSLQVRWSWERWQKTIMWIRSKKYLIERILSGDNKDMPNRNILLCWKTRTVAPDPRAPLTIELWFKESLIINPPYVWQEQFNKQRKSYPTKVSSKVLSPLASKLDESPLISTLWTNLLNYLRMLWVAWVSDG